MCQPGRPRPPGRVPPGVLARLVRLPQREVARVFLERIRLLLLDLVGTLSGQPPVLREARDPEVDVALDRIREVERDELLDQRDDLGDRLGRLRFVVGPPEPEAVRVLEVPARRVLGELRARSGRRFVDLVVDVGDVDDERRLVALVLEPALQPEREDGDREGVADVDALVHRRPAVVDPDRPRRRRQLLQPPRGGVIEPHRPSAAPRPSAVRR